MGLKDGDRDSSRSVERNYEKFIRNLRAKRPGVPIVMAEQCDVFMRGPNDKDRFIRALYEKLVAEGWKDLVYLPPDPEDKSVESLAAQAMSLGSINQSHE